MKMSKLFKTKNFIIIEGVIMAFIIFPITIGILMPGLFSILEKIFGETFSVCLDMGPSPEIGGSGLPCFYSWYYPWYALILITLIIVYFFSFKIHKLRNNT